MVARARTLLKRVRSEADAALLEASRNSEQLKFRKGCVHLAMYAVESRRRKDLAVAMYGRVSRASSVVRRRRDVTSSRSSCRYSIDIDDDRPVSIASSSESMMGSLLLPWQRIDTLKR